MGDVSDRPDVIEVPFDTVGESIFALSITTAEIENGVGLARDAVIWASVVVYNDSAGKDESMADCAATNSIDDAVPFGTLVATCDELSNCAELRVDSVAGSNEPVAELDNGCNVTVELTTA